MLNLPSLSAAEREVSAPVFETLRQIMLQAVPASAFSATAPLTMLNPTGNADIFGMTIPLGTQYGGTGSATTFTQGSVIFAGVGGAFSQDTTFTYDPTTKSLQVNSATPIAALTVTPRVAESAAIALRARVLTTSVGITFWNPTGGTSYGFINGGGASFQLDTASSSAPLILCNSGANIGIGVTPSSATRLQVAGMGLFTSGSYDPGDGSPAGVNVSFSGGFGFINAVQTGVAAKPLLINPSQGNVGVGLTTTPGQMLDVGTTTSHLIRSYGGFTGNASANIGGTGAAAYFPNGLYSLGANNWIYNTVWFNGSVNAAGATTFTGTNFNLAGTFGGNFAVAGAVTPGTYLTFTESSYGLTLGGNNNNIALTTSWVYLFAGSGAGACNITGISGGVAGRQITVFNNTGTNVTLTYQDTNSSVGNRIVNNAGVNLTLPQLGAATLIFEVNYNAWAIVSHN